MVSYKEAGVDIDKARRLTAWLKRRYFIGGFSGLYPLSKDVFLTASCDGVGTKLKIAFLLGRHDSVGIDLVAMNVNDVICCGARPLFFLDYFATSKLDLNVSKSVIKGIIRGCKLAGCTLIGGETAEMPGFYNPGEYELAGFCVGIVRKNELIDGGRIKPGDFVLGLPSSGLHSNGYSLVRKLLSEGEMRNMGDILLEPTKIYVKDIENLKKELKSKLHGIAHITGGGFYDNISRILPGGVSVVIRKGSWELPWIFKFIQKKGKVSEREMFRTFNMGLGMVAICSREVDGWLTIGEVTKGRGVVIKG